MALALAAVLVDVTAAVVVAETDTAVLVGVNAIVVVAPS